MSMPVVRTLRAIVSKPPTFGCTNPFNSDWASWRILTEVTKRVVRTRDSTTQPPHHSITFRTCRVLSLAPSRLSHPKCTRSAPPPRHRHPPSHRVACTHADNKSACASERPLFFFFLLVPALLLASRVPVTHKSIRVCIAGRIRDRQIYIRGDQCRQNIAWRTAL